MGQTDGLNTPKPPKFLECIVNLAVPRASREHVLGDLHERYVSPLGYLKDAASAVPGAILGQIRRITTVPYLLLEFVLIYASILIAAFWTRGMGPRWGGGDFSKSALAAVYLLMVVTAKDVYRGDPFSLTPEQLEFASRLHFKREVLRRISIVGDVFCITLLAFGAYYGAGLLFPRLSAFPPIMTTQYSTWLVTALLSPLRLWLGTRKHRPGFRA